MTLQIPTIALSGAPGARAELATMPVDFRLAFEAFASYLGRRLPAVPADAIASVLDDLVDLFVEAAADGIPLRAVVGEEPADVAEALLANHADAPCNLTARAELARAVDAVTP